MTSASELPLDDRRVAELIALCRHHNVFPIFLNRYYPATEQHPVATLLSSVVPEVAATLDALNDAELRHLLDSIPGNLTMFLDRGDNPRNPTVRDQLALAWIHWRMRDEYFSLDEIVHPRLEESAVLAQYPELAARFDDEGLLSLSKDTALWDGGIFYREHVLHYHQCLRRRFSSNPNFEFLGPFAAYCHATGTTNTFRVAIDHRRIMHRSFYERTMEMDRWFGATFDPARVDDPSEVGLTVLERSQPSFLDDISGRLTRTEVLRSLKGQIKTFELEEIADASTASGHYIFNRYVHAERDIQRREFRHFDGAVKVYLKDSYPGRLERFLPDKDSYRKLKLFRIDGTIPLEIWVSLTTAFFKGNEMIVEYFDPELYERELAPLISDYQDKVSRRSSPRLANEGPAI